MRPEKVEDVVCSSLSTVWSNSMIFRRSAVWYFYFHGLLIAPSSLFKSYAPG
jgi:hypothetical protein